MSLANVSRETEERLEIYAALLKKWNPKINLVARASLNDAGRRHFEDSAQIMLHAPTRISHWVDIGSGGGFPGLVAAILAQETHKDAKFTLIESDQRKCAFLRSVSRETSVPVAVLSERIEQAAPQEADVLSARALAPLSDLLGFATRHMTPNGVALFMKGAQWQDELRQAENLWSFKATACKSETDDSAHILKVTGVSRA
ncbi:16S rRNA (guanine(527)-N(7))-methyltransferase RsmG [Roseovarius sp.]|uniref:16S rRNA (guanine(527)-N(7))-methyltransferase RsmG n=1 Tax=Roseovarius sp. TaxID=1486281 RepID=UPI000C5956D4|nr:16S rRNA (guanine(527)-N(7))-methyltransferase RsmG [Roseovarius sp.]MAZ22375.1 16S rRNA (guanine(527)-N(7))-methyltransferase RsmG [Roseovarius sp.]|tara:strand:- start:900 stop:1502 length:603 start_codon:yes stop_codon:yes gene_type:complete